jgi:hypothetical protein
MSHLVEPYPFEAPAYQSIRYYRFFNSDQQEYNVQFVRDISKPFCFYVDLSIKNTDDEYETTNAGDALKIMSTTLHIIIDFIQHNPSIEAISFTAIDEEDHNMNRRIHLFERFCQQFKEIEGWDYTLNGTTIILSKQHEV